MEILCNFIIKILGKEELWQVYRIKLFLLQELLRG